MDGDEAGCFAENAIEREVDSSGAIEALRKSKSRSPAG